MDVNPALAFRGGDSSWIWQLKLTRRREISRGAVPAKAQAAGLAGAESERTRF